ncbi:hypothetical protein C806_01393 [Lachnospiraceae bacterium 3-1]|nr:hypothetical protein C806_01393 [Lachnospiraceae bacterium 3-1]
MILECKDLTKTYRGYLALSNINLQIDGGHIIGLLGPNGSGKTTLLKLIAGLLSPASGSISIQGNPVGPASKNLISYLPDHFYLDHHRKVAEIIRFFDDFYEDFESERAYDMLAKLNINPNQKLKSFSKGTKEKVHLILAMSRRAKLYLLDEPIAGVDPAARDYILQTILSNYEETASILISTHLISDIENILDEVIFLQNGKIHTHALVDELRQESHKSIDDLFREVFRC